MHAIRRLGLAAGVAMLAGACATTSDAPPGVDAARESLAASERAFARHSVEHGMRAAFLEYFADDGINFSPGPGNTRERFRARPEAIEPFVLDWHPAIAAVARAGDLGFTTGPYAITGRAGAVRKPAYGIFFSVWRRDDDGRWRVVVDGGGPTEAAVPDAAFGGDPRPLPAAAADASGANALYALESQALFDGPATASSGYAALLADDARLFIEPAPPRLGRDAILVEFAARGIRFRWETLAAGASRSDDLAYSYGRLHFLDAGKPNGHYIHVWLRDRAGRWRIVAEVLLLPDA